MQQLLLNVADVLKKSDHCFLLFLSVDMEDEDGTCLLDVLW